LSRSEDGGVLGSEGKLDGSIIGLPTRMAFSLLMTLMARLPSVGLKEVFI
jgi:hypothetical protein